MSGSGDEEDPEAEAEELGSAGADIFEHGRHRSAAAAFTESYAAFIQSIDTAAEATLDHPVVKKILRKMPTSKAELAAMLIANPVNNLPPALQKPLSEFVTNILIFAVKQFYENVTKDKTKSKAERRLAREWAFDIDLMASSKAEKISSFAHETVTQGKQYLHMAEGARVAAQAFSILAAFSSNDRFGITHSSAVIIYMSLCFVCAMGTLLNQERFRAEVNEIFKGEMGLKWRLVGKGAKLILPERKSSAPVVTEGSNVAPPVVKRQTSSSSTTSSESGAGVHTDSSSKQEHSRPSATAVIAAKERFAYLPRTFAAAALPSMQFLQRKVSTKHPSSPKGGSRSPKATPKSPRPPHSTTT